MRTRSPAQINALRRLHRSRRGIPVNDCAMTARDYLRTLAHVYRSLAIPGGPSIRGLARGVGVSPRTVGRWLRGEDIAPAWAVIRLAAMTENVRRQSSRKKYEHPENKANQCNHREIADEIFLQLPVGQKHFG